VYPGPAAQTKGSASIPSPILPTFLRRGRTVQGRNHVRGDVTNRETAGFLTDGLYGWALPPPSRKIRRPSGILPHLLEDHPLKKQDLIKKLRSTVEERDTFAGRTFDYVVRGNTRSQPQ